MRFFLFVFAALAVPFSALGQTAPASEGVWSYEGDGIRVELASLPHDVLRAFYGARGFDKPNTERLAKTGCVFRADMGNHRTTPDAPPVTIDLSLWRTRAGTQWRPLKLKEAWLADFAASGMPSAAQIAFRWATFPNQQTFQAGDFNWGMVPFSLPPSTPFDLRLAWVEGNTPHTTVLKGLTCASP